tara:strand:+ start:27196 stop:27366 length:171 start_codon:yes stop_codon:yes gene_type:complete
MNYEGMSNMEISAHHLKMLQEYEAIKTQIGQLVDKLDKLDVEYAKGKIILNKRGQI